MEGAAVGATVEQYKSVRIARDYSVNALIPKFDTASYPAELKSWQGLDLERLTETINGLNLILNDLESTSGASALDTVLTFVTCGLKGCCMTSHSARVSLALSTCAIR